jgi:hypothetical protein
VVEDNGKSEDRSIVEEEQVAVSVDCVNQASTSTNLSLLTARDQDQETTQVQKEQSASNLCGL